MSRQQRSFLFGGALAVFSWCGCLCGSGLAWAEFRVGAARVDVSPVQWPVLINGSMTSHAADQVTSPVFARAVVMDDGHERIGIVVVDSCMIPKQLCDEAKQLAAGRTQIRPDRMTISATHTHSAPSSEACLGTDADPNYVPYLREKLAEAIATAESKLQPARVGWGSGQAPGYTAVRRWVRRPDRIANDPFGNPTVRANMHAGAKPEDAIGPTGPEDPELSLIAFETLDGIPLAVLANFSMHYFGGERPVSADYFGRFCDELELALSPGSPVDMVAIMSHGCSGDIWRRDYLDPQSEAARSVEEFASGLSEIAIEAYRTVEFQSDPALSMLESRIPMRYRVPDAQRLQWARKVVDEMESKLPTTQPEIYAREQIFLDAMQSTEIVTQAICIGDIGIVTTPTETYALTGLKMKLQSPLEKTMVIELANGGDGYIPPPEQHVLGGYNTWAARSAGLEITAEPKVIARNLLMLEEIAQLPRRQFQQTNGPTALSILELNPKAYWRMHDWSPMEAIDVSGNECHGRYESGVVFFLEGPDSNRFSDGKVNRCAHFAGGRMSARLDLRESYTIVLSCWNGMPLDSRNITGWMLSHDRDDVVTSAGLHLGLDRRGRLIVQVGEHILATGEIAVPRWTWNQVALVRKPAAIQVYLNGSLEVECAVPTTAIEHLQFPTWFFGGRSDNDSNWEGRLDEIAVFDRALDSQALGRLFR